MELTNKQVAEKLKKYFVKQNIEDLAEMCSGFALDLNRFLNMENMSEEQIVHLVSRTKMNMQSITHFIQTGDANKLRIMQDVFSKEMH